MPKYKIIRMRIKRFWRNWWPLVAWFGFMVFSIWGVEWREVLKIVLFYVLSGAFFIGVAIYNSRRSKKPPDE